VIEISGIPPRPDTKSPSSSPCSTRHPGLCLEIGRSLKAPACLQSVLGVACPGCQESHWEPGRSGRRPENADMSPAPDHRMPRVWSCRSGPGSRPHDGSLKGNEMNVLQEALAYLALTGPRNCGRLGASTALTHQEHRELAVRMRALPTRFADRLSTGARERVRTAAAAARWENAVDELLTALLARRGHHHRRTRRTARGPAGPRHGHRSPRRPAAAPQSRPKPHTRQLPTPSQSITRS
jgi:hypothetical protein